MPKEPTYEELKKRIYALEQVVKERDRAIGTLKYFENIFHFFYHHVPFAYQSLDENGHILDVNDAWLLTLGYDREEVIGKSFGVFLHPNSRNHFKDYSTRFKAIGEVLGIELEMLRNNGETITVSFDGTIGKDCEGSLKKSHWFFQDITELKRTRIAAHQNEETARALLNASLDSAFLVDANGTFVDMNEVTARRLGKSAKDLLGKSLWDFIPPDLAKSRKKIFDRVIRDREPVRHEDTRSGFILDNNAYPVIDPDGNVNRVAVFSQDITKQKLAEKKLRESMGKFRSLVELTSDWIWEVDKNGAFTYASPNVETLLGYKPEDLIGKTTPFDFMPADEAKRVGELIKGIFSAHEPFEGLENVNIHKNGNRVVLETSGVPIFDPAGNLIGYRGIDRDITNRKQENEVLQESERKHKALINNIPGMVYRASTDWSADIFSGCENVSGYTPEELSLKEQNWLTIIHPDDFEWVLKQGTEISKSPQDLIQTYRIIDKSGNVRWVEDHKTSFVSDKGEFAGIDGVIFDITQRKRAEEELAQMAQQWQITFDTTNDAIWVLDQDAHIKLANKKAEELFHHPAKELIGKHCWEIAHGTEHPIPDCPNLRARHSLCRETMELQDGENWFKVTVDPVLNKSGMYQGAVHIVTDITELKLSEKKSRKNEERFKFLAENMADIVWTLDMDLNATYVSPSIEKVLGITPEERKRQKMEEIVTPDSLERITALFLEELQRDKEQGPDPDRSATIEVEYYHRDGSTVWMENLVKTTRNKQGEMVSIYGASRDITKRKRAQEALRESERKYQDLYDNAPDMFASVDSKSGIILQCNQTVAEALGCTKEEIIGRPVFDFYTTDSAEYAKSNVFPVFVKTGTITDEELQLQRKDGSTIDVSLNVSAIRDEKGNILHSRSVWRDITKRKLMEAEVKILSGFLPICASCKKIRDDKGYWSQIESYIQDRSEAEFSHSICPECAKNLYPDLDL